jgi:hypothetical protein
MSSAIAASLQDIETIVDRLSEAVNAALHDL